MQMTTRFCYSLSWYERLEAYLWTLSGGQSAVFGYLKWPTLSGFWFLKPALLHKSSIFSGHTSEADKIIKEVGKNSSSLWIHMKRGLFTATPRDGMRAVNIKMC